MRKINLGVGFSVELHVDLQSIDASKADKNGRVLVGSMDVETSRKVVNTARENGAEVVWAALEIESELKRIISLHMFNPDGINPARDFLNKDILGSSGVSFSFKRNLVQKIVQDQEWLSGKEKNEMAGVLRQIEGYRNAFAHGKISSRNNEGILEYFSGDYKEDLLTDGYWDELEKDFSSGRRLLKRIIEQQFAKSRTFK